MSQYDRPFDEYDRIKQDNDQYIYELTDNPLDFQDDLFADSDLAFMEFTDEILGDVQYGADAPDMSFLPPSQRGQGPRGVANQPEEYDRVHTYNDLLGRGISEEVALDWFDSGADTSVATNIIREEFVEKQDNYLRALDRLKEEDPTEFGARLNDADFADKMIYLSHLHDKGELTAKEYEKAYIDTYNNDQRLNSENPAYIMETQAIRDSPADSRYKYKSGDDVYIFYDPENPPSDQFPVIDPSSMLPHSRENEYRETGYVRDRHPSSEMSEGASDWMEFREDILKPGIKIAAYLTGNAHYYELANVGYKVASGQTLKTGDYVTLAIAGMDAAGAIQAPITEVDPITGTEVVVSAGKGIGNLTYDQTIAVVNAVANEDPLSAILGSTDILPTALAKAGIPQELIDDPDFMAGVTRSLETLASGEDWQQAVEDGLSKYAREGGDFGLDLSDGSSFDFDLGVLGDVLSSVGTAIGDIGTAVVNYADPVFQYVGDIGESFGDLVEPIIQVGQDVIDAGSEVVGDVSSAIGDVTDPITSAIGDVGSNIDDVVSDTIGDVSSAIGDVTDPITGAIGDAGSALDDTVSDTIGDVSSAIGDVTDPITSAIGDAGSALDDLRKELDFNLELQKRAATKTTDDLFPEFKLDSYVGITDRPLLEYQDPFSTNPFKSTI